MDRLLEPAFDLSLWLSGSVDFSEMFRLAVYQTMGYEPFVESQLASCNQLEGRMWCKFGHVAFKIRTTETIELHRVD
jgi:hypothetical protein